MKIGGEKSEIWVGGRTVTTASPRYLKRSDPLHKNSARIKPIEEYEDCVIHGDADGFAVKDLNGNEELVSVTMAGRMVVGRRENPREKHSTYFLQHWKEAQRCSTPRTLCDREYEWPSDLVYYVEKYNLRLPDDFEDHILRALRRRKMVSA